MKPSQAFMIGWLQGCEDLEKDESNIPETCLAAYGDGYDIGHSRRQFALDDSKGYDCLDAVNKKAFATWNLGGRRPDLPSPPSGSGCYQHYCWMPVDTRHENNRCKAHGGKDAPLPKAKGK